MLLMMRKCIPCERPNGRAFRVAAATRGVTLKLITANRVTGDQIPEFVWPWINLVFVMMTDVVSLRIVTSYV